jgi:CIC family chloride channel protein
VLSHDGHQLRGWITRKNVLAALAERVSSSAREIEQGALAAEFAVEDPASRVRLPTTPLRGYQIIELTIGRESPARGRRLDGIGWPHGSIPVAVTKGREILAARRDVELRAGERVIVLSRTASPERDRQQPFSAHGEP